MNLHGPFLPGIKLSQMKHDVRPEGFLFRSLGVLAFEGVLKNSFGVLVAREIAKEIRETMIRNAGSDGVEIIHSLA